MSLTIPRALALLLAFSALVHMAQSQSSQSYNDVLLRRLTRHDIMCSLQLPSLHNCLEHLHQLSWSIQHSMYGVLKYEHNVDELMLDVSCLRFQAVCLIRYVILFSYRN